MNSSCQRLEVGINAADDDPRVPLVQLVQPNEVAAVERDQRPAFADGKGENLLIGHREPRMPEALESQHVVTKAAESLNGRSREVLVGHEPGGMSFSARLSRRRRFCIRVSCNRKASHHLVL